MDVFDAAKQLGESIAASEQMTRFKKSEAAVEGDQKALDLLAAYKSAQLEVMSAARENKGEATLNEARSIMQERRMDAMSYEVTSDYLEAKREYDSLMKDVNEVIRFTITGEHSCSSSNCKSCGGGCKS